MGYDYLEHGSKPSTCTPKPHSLGGCCLGLWGLEHGSKPSTCKPKPHSLGGCCLGLWGEASDDLSDALQPFCPALAPFRALTCCLCHKPALRQYTPSFCSRILAIRPRLLVLGFAIIHTRCSEYPAAFMSASVMNS